MTRELAVPDEAVETLRVCDADRHLHERAETCVRAISTPVVTAELLSLADKIARTGTDLVAEEDRNGYDRAIGDVRDLIADRLAELGVKVEDL